jgi:hypothetical protein
MSNKTSNLALSERKRKISTVARKAMAQSGLANLKSWRDRTDARANKLESDVEAFRANLLVECGADPSTSRLGLVEAATTTYAAIVRVRRAVIRAPKAELAPLVERVSWLTGNLTRLLKSLSLDARPRPQTLSDLLMQRTMQNGQNSAFKPTKSEETHND